MRNNTGRRADAIARDHVSEAMEVIRDVMIDPLSETKDRLKAAEIIIERGEGKVAQAIIAIPGTKRMAEQYAAMNDDALLDIIQSQPLPRLGAPVTDAEFVDVTSATDAELLGEEVDPLLR